MIGIGAILFPLPIPLGLSCILGGLGVLQIANPSLSRKLLRRLKGVAARSSTGSSSKEKAISPIGETADP
jgi:hypothetical protein